MIEIKQIYHHYEEWEEYRYGMWRIILGAKRKEFLEQTIKFIGNTELYGSYMLKVVDMWPISCEQNLTCPGINKQAWIGQAACCIALGCPEDITREAWRYLSKKQQDQANEKADIAIKTWEEKYLKKLKTESRQLCLFQG